MKKKIIIISAIALVVAAVLFVPVPKGSYDDGGTKVYEALTYKLVKWNRLYEGDLCYNSSRIYFGEDKNKSIDELWLEINPDAGKEASVFTAIVAEVDKSYILVEPAEGTNERNSADKIYIPKSAADALEIESGDRIEIEYDGMIAEVYPAMIDNVFSVKNLGKAENFSERIKIEHNGTKVYMSEEDSEYIREVIDEFQMTENQVAEFGGNKVYTIYCRENPFGTGEIIYYDAGTGEIGYTSINSVPKEKREKFDEILSGYFAEENGRQGSTIKSSENPTEPPKTVYSNNSVGKVQYIRSGRSDQTKTAFPYAAVIKSKAELDRYYNDNKTVWDFSGKINGISFDEAIKKYNDAYFENNALVFAVTSEVSGSTSYKNASINGDSLNIEKVTPEVCTCDMAFWHIIFEVKKTDPILSGKININITEG